MGTRADFYVGTGRTAEWIGSVTMDGYPDGTPAPLLDAKDEAGFRAAVEAILADPSITTTRPAEGWPWPWEDSRTTDFAYAWCADGVPRLSCFGRRWETFAEFEKRCADEDGEDEQKLPAPEWPDMSARRADHDTIMAKSGLIVLGVR